MPETLLFAGPSAFGIAPSVFRDAQVRLRPPARRGDIERLLDDEPAEPGVLIVADGIFQVAAAVSHAELCAAMDAGWQVWGVSSLGAIRAHELRHEGMHGFGEVFAMFSRLEDFTDDEMCLLHFPEPPYFPVTEALVNVRHALARHGPDLGIPRAAALALVDALAQCWFGERTPALIRSLMVDRLGVAPAAADALLRRLESDRVKTTDLEQMMASAPWRVRQVRARTP
ncbi:MAG: TfuA-like protein [Vitreoscilla sp.]